MATPASRQGDTIRVLMHGRLTAEDLRSTFSLYGQVKDIQPFRVDQQASSRSYKCFTYITFVHPIALANSDLQINGIRVQVGLENASRQLEGEQVNSSQPEHSHERPKTVKVSIYGELTEHQLEQEFSKFGRLQSRPVVIRGDPIYSYINFQDSQCALRASQEENGKVIDGVMIKARLFESASSRSIPSQPTPKTVSGKTLQKSQYPKTWQLPMGTSPTLIDIMSGTEEWCKVHQQLSSTLPQVQNVSIQRIQNKELWDNYERRKQSLLKNGRAVNEKQLFHGTSDISPEKIYMDTRHGFDFRYCTEGMWGRGTYFAVNASYSDYYSFKDRNIRKMILARVLIGEACKIQEGRSLTHPPHKPGSSTERYDSVQGFSNGSEIFVVYEFEQAYPEYLIIYKKP